MSGRRPSENRWDVELLSGYSEPRAKDGSTLRKWALITSCESPIDRRLNCVLCPARHSVNYNGISVVRSGVDAFPIETEVSINGANSCTVQFVRNMSEGLTNHSFQLFKSSELGF